jgi:acylaminoacyl-peptidase
MLQYFQYARALKDRGIESKIIVFPEDIHGTDKLVSFYYMFYSMITTQCRTSDI